MGELRNYLQQSRLDFIDLGLDLSVGETTCRHQRCSSSQTCVLTNTPEESVSYNIPAGYMAFKQEEKCFCDDGSEGPVCYPRNSCLRNPCKFGEKCIQTTSSYRCECIDPSKCTMGQYYWLNVVRLLFLTIDLTWWLTLKLHWITFHILDVSWRHWRLLTLDVIDVSWC